MRKTKIQAVIGMGVFMISRFAEPVWAEGALFAPAGSGLAIEKYIDRDADKKEAEHSSDSVYEGYAVPAVDHYLNIRDTPSSSAEVVGKLEDGSIAKVMKKEKEWTQIQSGDVKGYASSQYLKYGEEIEAYAKEQDYPEKAVVDTPVLKVREKPDTESRVLSTVSEDSSYRILWENEAWVKVKTDGQEGYLSRKYVKVRYDFSEAEPAAGQRSSDELPAEDEKGDTKTASASSLREQIAAYAVQYVGNPYVYGGSSLTQGADCSGFVMKVYEHFGYHLSHNSAAQSGEGKEIELASIQPGDLLFYKSGGRINHVTMYIGNGKVVHASNSAPYPKGGIKISSVHYRIPCKAVRIIK